MRKIYGIGETVYDIIFKAGQPQAAKPGGSVLNSVVSLGRVGLPVSFITEYGVDNIGDLINEFLRNNGVDTTFVNRFTGGNTSLAIAFLDERNDAKYNFYKETRSKHLDIVLPETGSDDIVQCGSFFAIWPEIRERFLELLHKAVDAGAMVLYDPNFRKTHLSGLNELKPLIIENMKMATIVRGSDEDFANIFGAGDPDEAWKEVRKHCSVMVYTANVKGVFVRTAGYSGRFPVNKITPVSTIGAGDNFNAGMITSIFSQKLMPGDMDRISENEWSHIIGTAVSFATHVCMSYDNYISADFAKKFTKSAKA